MPYIIKVPAIPRPYITNDPRIYMDCARVLGWECEARPFTDSYCKTIQDREYKRNESDRRRSQLDAFWSEGLSQHTKSEEALAAAAPTQVEALPQPIKAISTTPVLTTGKHSKHDSVMGVVVNVKELATDEHDDFDEFGVERQGVFRRLLCPYQI